MHINQQQIKQYESQYRARLINSLSGFKSANLVGTINDKGVTNLSIISSVFHIGASPALVGLIIRPHSVPRHTFENILQTKRYTINHVSADFWQQAHQTSARYAQEQSEFKAVGLNEEYLAGCSAPFVRQSKLKYALELREVVHLAINGTELVIGEVTDIMVDQQAVRKDGYIDIESLETITLSGLDSYHTSQRLARLAYAKPQKPLSNLSLDGEEDEI
jgi:flavin reductase (DIM6/NTAB) family NADH-FMN oxidoreductase RutF